MKKPLIKLTARILVMSMTIQLVWPVYSYALTTGPSQPEVQSFEPVGTTEMVNLFSGDFNYNIPLLDIEGYPINIAYHSGINVEQEASWVGLGWNINPGEINRTVRGLPDDFNGERIEKELNIVPEKNYRVGVGSNFGMELAGGSMNLGLSLNTFVNYNNYKGMSSGMVFGVNASVGLGSTFNVGAGINMGIGSQTGADMDLNASVGAHASRSVTNDGGGGGASVSISGGTGFNSRTGLKDLSFGIGASATVNGPGNGMKEQKTKDGKPKKGDKNKVSGSIFSYGSSVPIGLQNYVPVITNATEYSSYQIQTKLGAEIAYMYPSMTFSAFISRLSYDQNGTRKGYGYLYMENAPEDGRGILDFSRDKDGSYNPTMSKLPTANMTYDIYTINGQGTGGMFRPFRNDIGTVYDPYTSSSTNAKDLMLEFGYGNLFEVGADINLYENESESGPWKKMPFGGNMPGNIYEKAYFKQAGELTYNQQSTAASLFNDAPQYVKSDNQTLGDQNKNKMGDLPNIMHNARVYWNNGTVDRTARANLLTYLTAGEAAIPDIGQYNQYPEYKTDPNVPGRFFDPLQTKYDRYNTGTIGSPNKDHISEFTQTLPDGRRYIYGIPAMNNATREVTFNVDETRANIQNGTVAFNQGSDDSKGNAQGREHFYSSTTTPAYAHSYLLTSVLSNDYVDIMGDGPTDDDLGTYVKFNYNMVDNDYRWRAPYEKGQAQYNPGFWSDARDGKGNYIVGSRQQWHIRSIETKNYIAEFYISPRADGRGTKDRVVQSTSRVAGTDILKNDKATESVSYKLDSIRLYNKHDRYLNEQNAVPVKTVIFSYSYRLCPGTLNSTAPATTINGVPIAEKGKLTLEKIYIRYGNSDKNLLSPYSFSYNTPNPAYDFAAKDRWGSYKANGTPLSNYEYPYTEQETPAGADPITAWNLSDIKLPSGGTIHVDYESDDYSYVQDKRSMQMFRIYGVGSSSKLTDKNTLYEDAETINQYVYFKRRVNKENPALSLRENYLEDQELLYYSFNLDITGNDRYEHIKGYAKIEEVGVCPDDTTYGYVKLKKEEAGKMSLHPATVYGLNIGRYYLPHILYKGFKDSDGSSDKQVMLGLLEAANELITIGQNPFRRFVKEGKGRKIDPDKSWVRLHTPGLTKRGGGVRVRQLVLNDNWSALSNSPANATYGKKYDYTIQDERYGTISSGVASYEPMIGADENAFRKPEPYQAESGRLLPAIDFFQEEPYGESFFPSADVGYSSVKVRSIHADSDNGRSSQSEEEHLYYTARDFPATVKFTDMERPDKPKITRKLRLFKQENYALQGCVLTFNDMHGKPKADNNYLIKTGSSGHKIRELITGSKYNYHQDAGGKLNNTVKAMARVRGTLNSYAIQNVSLGKEMDFTVDSRQRFTRSFNRNVALNLNVVLWGTVTVPIFTAFFPDKEEVQLFQMQVSTKIIQQYGVLKSTEVYDHGARTITENMLYDAETGGVLLTQTNNEYQDKHYSLNYPAYLAYNGMGSAYNNAGYMEHPDSLVVNKFSDGFLYTDNLDRFNEGDELLVYVGKGGRMATYKLWVLGTGINTDTTTEVTPDPGGGTNNAKVVFWLPQGGRQENVKMNIVVECNGVQKLITKAKSVAPAVCDGLGVAVFDVPAGEIRYTAHDSWNAVKNWWSSDDQAPVTVAPGGCVKIMLPLPAYPGSDTYVGRPGGAYRDAPGTNGKRCALLVAPRYKGKFSATVNPTTNVSGWPVQRDRFNFVQVKVIRSGKRNNLTSMVQNTTLTQNPLGSNSNIVNLFKNNTQNNSAFNKLLAIAAHTYTDSAVAYGNSDASVAARVSGTGSVSDYRYTDFNKFVMGYRGTYRPLAEYVRMADRVYANHARFDGMFPMIQGFWDYNPSAATGDCWSQKNALQRVPLNPMYWSQAKIVTKYDVSGNALEEKDALGNYSAAQYGYNKLLPVAVAANVQQEHFFFEGFEDYAMLLPEYMYRAFVANTSGGGFTAYRTSPYSLLFNKVQTGYTNGNFGGRPVMLRSGQGYHYFQLQSDVSSGLTLSKEASHSGAYSLKCTGNATVTIPVTANNPAKTSAFACAPGKKYLVNAWVRPFSAGANPSDFFKVLYNGNTIVPAVKTARIDGWYLLEGILDLSSASAGTSASLMMYANAYLDDIRVFPMDANMKSFVYDPLTFKLSAQLDENHFATFYEYDQEGLLIRVKKETDRGIMTISESRRSNSKNP